MPVGEQEVLAVVVLEDQVLGVEAEVLEVVILETILNMQEVLVEVTT